MNNLVIELKIDRDLRDDDIIVYRDKHWQVINKKTFIAKEIADQREINDANEKRIEKLENDVLKLALIIKEK